MSLGEAKESTPRNSEGVKWTLKASGDPPFLFCRPESLGDREKASGWVLTLFSPAPWRPADSSLFTRKFAEEEKEGGPNTSFLLLLPAPFNSLMSNSSPSGHQKKASKKHNSLQKNPAQKEKERDGEHGDDASFRRVTRSASVALCQSADLAPIYSLHGAQPLTMQSETQSPQQIIPTSLLSHNSPGVCSNEGGANPHSSGTGVVSGPKSRRATRVAKAFLSWGTPLGIPWDSCGESTHGAFLIQSGWKGSAA